MYCCFITFKLYIGRAAIVLLLAQYQFASGEDLSAEENHVGKTNSKRKCGILQTSNGNKTFYDRDEPVVTDSPNYVEVEEECEMKICFTDNHDYLVKIIYCHNYAIFNGSVDYEHLSVVAVRCSCKPHNSTCKEFRCENVTLQGDECARLYEESDCRECRYDYRSLNANSDWIPEKGFFVGSFLVKPECELKVEGLEDPDKTCEFYEGIQNDSQLSYIAMPNKNSRYNFTCSCKPQLPSSTPKDDNNGSTINNGSTTDYNHGPITDYINGSTTDYIIGSTTDYIIGSTTDYIIGSTTDYIIGSTTDYNNESTIVIIVIALMILFAVALIVMSFAYLRSQQNVMKMREKAASEAISKFHVGDPDSDLDSPHQENLNYMSFGYIQAIKLPYETKYEIPQNCFSIDETKELGTGAYGKVLLGRLVMPQSYNQESLVAVKIAKCKSSLHYFVSLLDEIKILAYIGSHPNVVNMIGACTENLKQGNVLLLLEYCGNGSVKTYLHSKKELFLMSENLDHNDISVSTDGENTSYVTIKPEMSWQFYKWAKDILSGVDYLSSIQVVHIDLAARNILLTNDLVAKICDFGLSRRINDLENYVKLGEGYPLPFRNMALESLTDYRFSTQSDIWSYGVTLWELFTLGEDPYRGISNNFELITYLKNNNRLGKPAHSSKEMYSEMLRCWAYEPTDRPTLEELKTFFESLSDLEEITGF